jgi:hypothetical protein
VGSEWCFITPCRVKIYHRNSKGQECPNALTILSIHKDVTAETLIFNQKEINCLHPEKSKRAVSQQISFMNYLEAYGLVAVKVLTWL